MPAKTTRTSNSGRNNPLNRYQSMRDFRVTGEPRGSKSQSRSAKRASLPFVIQKHAATRLHYDFRLGWDGVLKSWAVTKGPSYNPADKRLAVQVEDHPWEYRTFEGIIPKSQYGGGTVMVWDQGTWIPHGDVDDGLKKGHLKFELHGKKLQGDWVLVRMHGRAERPDKPNWLLIKEKDEFARNGSSVAITDEAQNSAASERTMEEIAANSTAEVTRELASAAKGQTHAKRTSSPRSNPKRGGVVKEPSGLTHPDKVLDAESGLTKRALAEYFIAVAEHLLPQVVDRPLSVVRCPDGNAKPCFFQKHVGMGTAESVKSITIKNRKNGEKEQFLTVDSVEGLVGLAQMGVLEIHTWGSRNESIDHPDRIVFDLDPDPAVDWDKLAATAIELRSRLTKSGLKSFLKGTGGKGLHVVVPVKPEYEWREIKAFAHELVLEIERENPQLYITKSSLAARKNRIFLDYLRNDREATSVAPFSPRARSGAPVSVPLDWSELKLPKLPMFYLTEFDTWRKRLRNDPWRNLPAITQSIPREVLKNL